MKIIKTFVFITTLVAFFSVTTATGEGQQESKCDSDTDCASPLICLKHKCTINFCAPQFFKIEHATCTPVWYGSDMKCNYGYEYNNGTCEPIQSSETGYEGNNCTASRDCLTSLECVDNKCIDPCKVYGPNPHVDCKVVYHEKKFTCHPGYEVMSSYLESACFRVPELACGVDTDCLSSEICDFYGDCIDPCLDPPVDFVNGDCTVKDHKFKISCHTGYEPIPCSHTCEKIIANDTGFEGNQCSSSTDCMSSLACTDGQCVDPCKTWSSEDLPYCITVNHIPRHTRQCY